MRAALRAAVLVVWAATMALLVGRVERPAPEAPRLRSELSGESTESWQGIYRSGSKVGYAHRRRIATDDGFVLESRAVVRLRMMGASRVVRTDVSARTDRRLELHDFSFRVSADAIHFDVSGVVRDGALEVRVSSDGDRAVRVPLTSPIVLPQTLHEVLGEQTLETGKIFRYAMFDPMSAEPSTVEIEVGEKTTLDVAGGKRTAWELLQVYRGSEFRLWIDPDGEVLREEGPLGLTLVLEDEASATSAGFEDGEALDIVSAAAIPASAEIPSPREVRTLRLRLTGVPDGQTVAYPPRQTADGDRLEIRRETDDGVGTFRLPADAGRFAADVAATPFVQSDDSRIRATAAKILDGETDARLAARSLLDWVFQAVAKIPTVSVPDALAVLDSREGDCNEHAVLYTALARSAGLPARIVAGAVYMSGDGGAPGAFYYHAWVEVWLGEWIAVDPTFGQFPADATHVKLLDGGPEKHAALVSLIGRLQIEVEDFG